MREHHELSKLFPAISKPEFDELVNDVRQHGQREPITLYEGKVLDGRQREAACIAAGIKPFYVSFESLPDHMTAGGPLAFVLSENLHRRHLKPGEYVNIHRVIVPQLQKQLQEQAKKNGWTESLTRAERTRRHLQEEAKSNGEVKLLSPENNSKRRPDEGESRQTFKREAVKLAAKMTGTSVPTVYRNLSKPRPKPKRDMTAGLKATDSIRKVINATERNGGSLYFEIPGPDGGYGIRCARMKRIRGCHT